MAIAIERKLKVVPLPKSWFLKKFYKRTTSQELDFKKRLYHLVCSAAFFLLMSSIQKGTRINLCLLYNYIKLVFYLSHALHFLICQESSDIFKMLTTLYFQIQNLCRYPSRKSLSRNQDQSPIKIT
jgi:hypothetical protein